MFVPDDTNNSVGAGGGSPVQQGIMHQENQHHFFFPTGEREDYRTSVEVDRVNENTSF